MYNPTQFWNIAPVEVKRRIQYSVFPECLEHDSNADFRTPKITEFNLSLIKIAIQEAKNKNLVDSIRMT